MKVLLSLPVFSCVGIWLGVFSFFITTLACASAETKRQKLDQALLMADEQDLWHQAGWLRLLHIDPTHEPLESRIDGGQFFLTPQGGRNPRAEGEENLRRLFLPPDTITNPDSQLQCRFPARTDFLFKHLDSKQSVDHAACPALTRWLSSINANKVTLVFPVGYLNNPASIFGHTFLRLDSREFAPAHHLLSSSVGYVASTLEEKGVQYAFNGVFGGYTGRFSVMPYYKQARAYGTIENRDIWEYPLNLSPSQVRLLLYHVWELLQAEFDYYFFDENCAYQILGLLEAVNPDWSFTSQFPLWTIPVDTVRLVQQQLGNEHGVDYRPSKRTQLSARLNETDPHLAKIARDLIRGSQEIDDPDVASLPLETQAKLLDLAVEFLLFEQITHQGEEQTDSPLLTELLRSRSMLGKREQMKASPPSVRPDQGHSTSMMALGIGFNDSTFLRLEYRPVLHDLYDLPGGYDAGAQLEFFTTVLDYSPREEQLRLHSLSLVDIISLPEGNLFLSPISWSAYLGLEQLPLAEEQTTCTGRGRAGWGYRLGGDNAFLYGLAGGDLLASDNFETYADLGPFLESGVMLHWGTFCSLGWKGRLSRYLLNSEQLLESSLVQDIHLNRDNSMRFTFTHQSGRSEINYIMLSWRYFFSSN